MEVLIIGASSYIGARLYQDLGGEFTVSGTYNSTRPNQPGLFYGLDIRNPEQLLDLVGTALPEVIIHAAAIASTSECNDTPRLAEEVNIQGTRNVVSAANSVGAKLIFLSTMGVTSSSVYGQTKAEAERIVKADAREYVIIRPSTVFGMSPNTTVKKHFNLILREIEGNGPGEYENSWRYQPTWIRQLSEAASLIIAEDVRGETIQIAVSDTQLKTTFDIARDILAEFGITPRSMIKEVRAPSPVNLDSMKALGLPSYSYNDMIKGLVGEIREYRSALNDTRRSKSRGLA